MSGISLKERMEARKDNYLLRLDTHIDMINATLSRNAPVLSQAVSALTVGYSVYEGVSRWIAPPLYASIVIGIVAAGAIETVGFMAVDERDRGEAYNRQSKDKIDTKKSEIYVRSTFWITFCIVAVTEVLPAFVGLYLGNVTIPDALFKCAILLFPCLSRLGANLYAFRSARIDAMTKLQTEMKIDDELELAKRNARHEQALKDIEAEAEKRRREHQIELEQKVELARIEQLRAEQELRERQLAFEQQLKLAEEKAHATIRIKEKKSDQDGKSIGKNLGKLPENYQDSASRSRERMMEIILAVGENGSVTNRELGVILGTSHVTAGKLVNELVGKQVLDAIVNGKQRTLTINGKHEDFIAGKI